MTKKVKYILTTLVVAIFLVASLGLIAACTPSNESVTYTVTVQKDASTPVSGVTVQIVKGSVKFSSKKTDENGQATFELAADSYTVSLSDLPGGYNADNADLSLTADKTDLTVTLDKNFVYVVKLVDEAGAPYYAENVYVTMCTLKGNCLTPVVLGTDGIAELPPNEGIYDYHVKVDGLPVNYSVGYVDADGYYTGKNFSATETEMTIIIYNITSISDVTPMTEAEKAAYAQNNASYKNDGGQQYESYQVSKQVGAGEVEFFSFKATVSGQYVFYINYDVSYLPIGAEFDPVENGQYFATTLNCEAGKTYYFKAINNGNTAADAKFVMTAPYSSYISQTGIGANIDVTIGKANTNAVLAFTATEAGTYSVKVEGEAKAIVTVLTAQPSEIISAPYADSEYKTNPSTTLVAYTSTISASNYVTVTAKADKYPIKLKVTITKTAKANDTKTTVDVTETLTQYAKPQGKELAGVPMDGTATIVYNQTDRYYHLGTIDGPVVVVKITKPLDASRFDSGATLAYMELSTDSYVKYKFVERKADGESVKDYTLFIRGFDEYDKGATTMLGTQLVIPTNITTEVYYAKYVNEDGVYPLTDELKTFLTLFCKANSDIVSWNVTATTGHEWLFPCYYYVDATEADPIVGTYKFVSLTEEGTTFNVGDTYSGYCGAVQSGLNDGKLTADSCIIRVNKNGSYVILAYDSDSEVYDENPAYDKGNWTKDGTYAFTCEYGTLTYSNGTFTYVDGDTTITFGVAANS